MVCRTASCTTGCTDIHVPTETPAAREDADRTTMTPGRCRPGEQC